MASIRVNATKNGATTYSVLYRHHGKQPSKTFATRKKAEAFAALASDDPDKALRWLEAEERGSIDRLTVHQLAGLWLDWKASRVTARTLTDYKRDVANWVDPWLGDHPADTLDEADVQRWVDHMATRLEPKSVADRHMLLHSMFKFGRAKSRHLVSHNPCEETELPKRVKKPPKGTTVPEFRAILEAAQKRNQDAADLILFLGETGWRFSEATALDVRQVDDDGDNVWVTVAQVFRIDGKGRQVIAIDSAKSHAAFRRIRLFPATARMIRRRVIGKGPGDLVFTNTRGNHWNQHTFLRETWPRIITDAQLGDRKPTPHWLRHMHVAVLAAAGVPIQEIQRRIGHESITTTIGVYGGMVGDLSDTTLGSAAAIMAGQKTAPGVAPQVVGEVIRGELS